ncbi:hypothetical protein LXL04_035675 [Taraxacum kok-saghyz]
MVSFIHVFLRKGARVHYRDMLICWYCFPIAFQSSNSFVSADNAPFQFPGFSLMCAAFSVMIAFIQSVVMMKTPPLHGSDPNTGEYES